MRAISWRAVEWSSAMWLFAFGTACGHVMPAPASTPTATSSTRTPSAELAPEPTHGQVTQETATLDVPAPQVTQPTASSPTNVFSVPALTTAERRVIAQRFTSTVNAPRTEVRVSRHGDLTIIVREGPLLPSGATPSVTAMAVAEWDRFINAHLDDFHLAAGTPIHFVVRDNGAEPPFAAEFVQVTPASVVFGMGLIYDGNQGTSPNGSPYVEMRFRFRAVPPPPARLAERERALRASYEGAVYVHETPGYPCDPVAANPNSCAGTGPQRHRLVTHAADVAFVHAVVYTEGPRHALEGHNVIALPAGRGWERVGTAPPLAVVVDADSGATIPIDAASLDYRFACTSVATATADMRLSCGPTHETRVHAVEATPFHDAFDLDESFE